MTRTFCSCILVGLGVGSAAALAVPAYVDNGQNAVTVDELKVDPNSGRWPGTLPQSSSREIIVQFEPNVPQDVRMELLDRTQCRIDRSCAAGGFDLVRIPEWMSPEQMVQEFEQCEEVRYAELDYYAYATFVPDDSFYPLQWNLDNKVTGGIRMEAAWDLQRGDPNVIVAVLDTGVAFEDFEGFRQAPDLSETTFVPGYDFVNEDDHPNDDDGHGTHVTGTIAQSTNNGTGVAGIAFGCSIMPVKVLDEEGVGDHFNVARGIFFAVDNGARIINLSLGSPQRSQTLANAVAAAYRRGVTIVCAAGNQFLDGNPTIYPAAFDAFCIAVGAVRYDLLRAPYSSTGTFVDVVAPGGDVSVDQNGDGFADGILQQTFSQQPDDFAYWFFQGTSMAAPHVSAVAALLASRGVTRPDKIREAIEATATDLGPPGWDEQYGWGLVDAPAALSYRIAEDLDGDNIVGPIDLLVLTAHWLASGDAVGDADLNTDRRVTLADLAVLATRWDGPWPAAGSVAPGPVAAPRR